jgi:hypothetical protein
MKPSRAFWGILFVAFGGLFLLGRNFNIDIGWGYIWKFWPLVFVLIGLAVMLKEARVKLALAGVAGLFVALFMYGLLSFSWIDSIQAGDVDEMDDVQVQEFTEPLSPSLKKATLTLDAAAGSYTIDTVAGQLLTARVKTSIGRYSLDRESNGDDIHLRFKPEGQVHIRNWKHNRVVNVAKIRLNVQPTWDIDLNIGAAKVDFDLSPFTVEHLNVEAGAAAVRLKLGMPEVETRCRIEAGASSMRLAVPEEAGCEIRFDGGLSSKRFEDFHKVSDHIYRTENFDRSAKKIFIDADAGVSSLRVVRY